MCVCVSVKYIEYIPTKTHVYTHVTLTSPGGPGLPLSAPTLKSFCIISRESSLVCITPLDICMADICACMCIVCLCGCACVCVYLEKQAWFA